MYYGLVYMHIYIYDMCTCMFYIFHLSYQMMTLSPFTNMLQRLQTSVSIRYMELFGIARTMATATTVDTAKMEDMDMDMSMNMAM